MIEDKSEKLLIESAQKVINLLCKENDLPIIPVIFVKHFDNKFTGAYFDLINYRIEINFDTPPDALIHEFLHYKVKLFTVMDDCEENLIKRATDGYFIEIQKEQKAKLHDSIKDFELHLDEKMMEK